MYRTTYSFVRKSTMTPLRNVEVQQQFSTELNAVYVFLLELLVGKTTVNTSRVTNEAFSHPVYRQR